MPRAFRHATNMTSDMDFELSHNPPFQQNHLSLFFSKVTAFSRRKNILKKSWKRYKYQEDVDMQQTPNQGF